MTAGSTDKKLMWFPLPGRSAVMAEIVHWIYVMHPFYLFKLTLAAFCPVWPSKVHSSSARVESTFICPINHQLPQTFCAACINFVGCSMWCYFQTITGSFLRHFINLSYGQMRFLLYIWAAQDDVEHIRGKQPLEKSVSKEGVLMSVFKDIKFFFWSVSYRLHYRNCVFIYYGLANQF